MTTKPADPKTTPARDFLKERADDYAKWGDGIDGFKPAEGTPKTFDGYTLYRITGN